ncbi:unnamed protein product [Rotaria sordida]|uniref:Aminoglycoside phosphotransferase domain-containing protein n=1 Tax=Rotaria sordida TaxID=392033 RepID=A0A819DLZ2_9BILA|nr:unnamed protein product [Rotaria sordida]CAF3836563.1 unnamed protein product [Rotaria sordida]
MTRTPGKPLRTSTTESDIWPKLSIEKQKLIFDELVEYVTQLHSRIPSSNKIGNYKSNGQIGHDSNLQGPWNNYREFFYDQLELKIKTLNEENIFDPVRDDVMKSIKEFQKLNLPEFNDLPNVFTHYDLGLQNLTVNDNYKITGIIDWEWAGSYPVSEEYFHSYKPIVYDNQLKNYLFDQLENHTIPTPRTISRFTLLQNLYDFLESIVPWYLTKVANPEHPIVEKKIFENRDKVKTLVEQIKQELN